MNPLSPPQHKPLPGQYAWLRRFLAVAAFAALLLSLLSAAGLLSVEAGRQPAPAQSLGANVVISQFRVIGPLGGNDEFIEIFNPTQEDIDISGWQILGSNNNAPPATGVRYTFPSGTSITKGQYRLIAHSGHGPDVVPDSDITPNTYSTGIVDAGGIALRTDNGVIVDQVGMGINSAYKEGTHLPPLTGNNNRSYIRNPSGQGACFDYNNNATDFQEITPSQPRNSSSPATPCPAPTPTPDGVRRILINEIAWGGTTADGSAGQWIELHNPGPAIDITGWTLAAADGIPVIVLSGTIPANGYFLLARRSDVFSSIPVNQVFLDPLQATGETLRLYNNIGQMVDSANLNGGPWPAGSGFPAYASMERNANEPETDASWINFAGTPFASDRSGNPVYGSPGQPNWSLGMTQTPSPTPTNTPTNTPTSTPTPTLTPTLTLTPSGSRSVIINEIAWMGTLANANHEWIELYNPGSTAINITGWKLSAVRGGTMSPIILSGVIQPESYFLLERTSDDTISNIAADQIYTGALVDDGMSLELRTSSNELIDTANSTSSIWLAGDKDKRCSMERRPGPGYPDTPAYWITNSGSLKNGKDQAGNDICGTPRNVNWANYVTPTLSPVGPTHTPTRTRTPTRIPPARISQVIINEFLPFPGSDWNNDGKVDSGDEFIELMNVGNVAANLQGWRLDDQAGDSSPYTIGAISLAPGARVVFFASETGILLSNRSDSVRVIQPNGVISDAFTYTTVPKRDQSWCRLPDGSMNWTFGCEPTPGLINQLAQIIFHGERDLPAICSSPLLPVAIFQAECQGSGQATWSRQLWDGLLPVFRVLFERQGQEHWVE